jgi:hypothetical protein
MAMSSVLRFLAVLLVSCSLSRADTTRRPIQIINFGAGLKTDSQK